MEFSWASRKGHQKQALILEVLQTRHSPPLLTRFYQTRLQGAVLKN